MFDTLCALDFGRFFLPEPNSNYRLAVLLFMQLAVILLTCRAVGFLGKRLLGQPQVVCEMIAGVMLGPSLFGLVAPDVHAALFPKQSLATIYMLAQVGLVLYMFVVGLEFDISLIRTRAKSAISVSMAGIITPFALGAAIAWFTRSDRSLFNESVKGWEAMLFMGAAMSITAFPMLARIISERGLAGTSLGTLALAAGSSDDAVAWCMLAIVLASFQNDPVIAVFAIGGGVAYALFCMLVARRVLRGIVRTTEQTGEISQRKLAVVLILLMIGAYFTDAIGIYAVFGAFILGIAMPRGKLGAALKRKIEPLTVGLLLPMFFVFSGLNTKISLINSAQLWLLAAGALAAACFGKGVACFAAAKMHGEPTRDAIAIGALMNARGLMELIILNIGYERGVITQTLFSIMIVMAIVTTLMATPLFEWVLGRQPTAPSG